MLKVINVKEYEGGLDRAISYIHGKWGNCVRQCNFDPLAV